MKADSHGRGGGEGGFARGLVLLGTTACLCVSTVAHSQPADPPARVPGAKALAGAIIEHQETSGGRIIYLEAKGGLVTPLSSPVPGSRREDLPALTPNTKPGTGAQTPARKPAVAPGRAP